MALQISISNAIGARAVAGGGGIDPDAQAFITAASITDPTQQSAINQLVVDLKGYSIWSKFQALYPMVGGTSTTHKWNLKDPRDLDAAFRLVFNGGWTHSSTGATPNGTNAYADTKYVPSSNLTDINSNHISFYSRTNAQGGIEMGGGPVPLVDLALRYGSGGGTMWNMAANANIPATTDSRYFLINTRTASNLFKYIKNGTTILTTSTGAAGTTKPNVSYYIGKRNYPDTIYSTLQCAFASIGDGLTDTEAANLYTAVQAFQVTLGRSIGTQTVSDADAQAFVTAANIVDQVEATAVNNLVIGLKADSLWTKMKAVYPFVGGSASTHKWNLKDPRDLDAAFRLVFNGGWTHSSTGATGNATNGYANTYLTPSTSLSLNSTHLSYYSRTNTATINCVEMGVNDGANTSRLFIAPNYSGTAYRAVNSAQASGTGVNMQGFFIASRVNSTAMKLYKNSSVQFNDSVSSGSLYNFPIFLSCYNSGGSPQFYSDRQVAFASIGDGLTDTDATNLNTRITTFQTALNRNV